MVIAVRKMHKFKDGILARIDEKFNSLKTDILAELKDQIKKSLLKSSNRQYQFFRSMVIIIKIK